MKPSAVLALVASAALILAAWAVGQSAPAAAAAAAPAATPSSKPAPAAAPAAGTPAKPAKPSRAILPATRLAEKVIFAVAFDNATGQDQYDPAAAGIGDLIAVMLAQHDGIRVVERQRLDALTAEQARSLRGLTGEKYAVAAGKLFHADTVVTGSLYLVQGKLTVTAKAMDIATERVAAAGQLATRPEYLVEDALQLSRNLAKQMSMPLPAIDPAKIDKMPIASLHFGQALSSYYSGNLNAAIMGFMRTLDLNPDFSETLFWSGLCYSRLNEPEHAAIDLADFLKREPNSIHAEFAKQLLADAREKEKNSTVERLTPADLMKNAPTTQPAATQPAAGGMGVSPMSLTGVSPVKPAAQPE
jgi:tetratricopeptide (TPR) repeat protein